MYYLIKILSFFIRQFFLPNPFINIFSSMGIAELVNLICGGVFIKLAYWLTGTWYVSRRGEEWKGSLGFLVSYFLLSDLFIKLSNYIHNIYYVIGLFGLIYIILYIVEIAFFDRDKSFF